MKSESDSMTTDKQLTWHRKMAASGDLSSISISLRKRPSKVLSCNSS